MRPAIVGLTGPNAAGKGEAARYLQERGFDYHSLSDVVREEATRRDLDHSRENLIRVGNELRATDGPGALAERIAAKIGSSLHDRRDPDAIRVVVDSIRSPAEVSVLRRLPGFVLVGIDAPIVIRFERSRRRGRFGDGLTLEEFARKETLEDSTDPAAQQLSETLRLADVVVDNSGTLEDLRAGLAVALHLEAP